jgi:hypothetical protein
MQQRPPTQDALVHQLLETQKVPAVSFVVHFESLLTYSFAAQHTVLDAGEQAVFEPVAVHGLQSPQQAPTASRPETENWAPPTHGLQVPAAPTLVAEPPSKPMIAPAPEAAQQVVFVPQTTSVVVVPSAETYSVSAVHVLWAAHLESAVGKWLAAQVLHFPFEAPHAEHSVAYAADAQQWPPTHDPLSQPLFMVQEAPAAVAAAVACGPWSHPFVQLA